MWSRPGLGDDRSKTFRNKKVLSGADKTLCIDEREMDCINNQKLYQCMQRKTVSVHLNLNLNYCKSTRPLLGHLSMQLINVLPHKNTVFHSSGGEKATITAAARIPAE